MMARFTTKKISGQKPRIHGEKDDASAGEAFLHGTSRASIVEVLSDPAEDADWVRVRRQKVVGGPFTEGWMRRAHLDAPADPPPVRPVPAGEFVRACARQELAATAGGDPAHAVKADYLIALALIESGLERFEPQTANSDGVGPYQFNAKAWDELAMDEGLTPIDRFGALSQIRLAAAVARRDWIAYSAFARPGGDTAPDGPFVPSFLNLFHAWLIGVPAAQEVDRANSQGDTGALIGPILEKHHPGSSNELMVARARFLRDGGNDARVAGFVRLTTEALNEALAKAFTLLIEHFPEFANPASGTSAPWMAIAERELQFWESNGLDESLPDGKERVRAYFAETDHGGSADAAWCGAFVAYCLKKCGNARAAASVIPGAARAANWKSWGDLELRGNAEGMLRRGAVVLLSPAKGTSNSGHVGFVTGTTAGKDRFFVVSGNQSNRVKVFDYPFTRVVAVRWLDVDGQEDIEAELVDPSVRPVGNATPQDLLTMARTLYGEARGEPQEGLEAVASVIMNRTRSARYPNTITEVCIERSQFSCWNKNDPNRLKIVALQPNADPQIEFCMQVAQRAASGALADATGGALHYHAVDIPRPGWVLKSPGAKKVAIANHIFYTGIR